MSKFKLLILSTLFASNFFILSCAVTPNNQKTNTDEIKSTNQKNAGMVLDFMGKVYTHRWSKDSVHEFTPLDESDLNKWHNMITYTSIPNLNKNNIKDVVIKSNNGYKQLNAQFIKVFANKKTNEVLEVITFPVEPLEIAFTLFTTDSSDRVLSITYSHRLYGKQTNESIKKWLDNNMNEIIQNMGRIPKMPAEFFNLLPKSKN